MKPSAAVWLFGLAGPAVWAAHLGAIYALASLGEVTPLSDTAVRLAILVATLAAVAVQALVLRAAWQGRLPRLAAEPDDVARRFWRAAGGIGALVGLVAVLWQTAPVLFFG